MNILTSYLSIDGLTDDPSQLRIVKQLYLLQQNLVDKKHKRLLKINFKKKTSIHNQGMYIWGDIGRGKTFLMNLFFKTLDIKDKKRIHFHDMLDMVHKELKSRNNLENPLEDIIKSISKNTSVICFDEFYIEDIADAMILSKVLEYIFKYDIFLFVTSNIKPEDLYKNGLQRELFLPAIDLINKHLKVIKIDEGNDYRLKDNIVNHTSNVSDSYEIILKKYFKKIAGKDYKKNHYINIRGRKIESLYCGVDIIWFDFLSICGDKRSKNDYIDIAKKYRNIIISNIINMNEDMENEARRFIALVDELYDKDINLIIATDSDYANLYKGNKLINEYKRTKSRLIEMQNNNPILTK